MKENFHNTQILSKQDLAELQLRNNAAPLAKISIILIAYLILLVVTSMNWGYSIWSNIALVVAHGLFTPTFFAAMHESGHGTAFASKRLNQLVSFLAGFQHIYPPSIFKEFHFTHHRYTHIPGKDPEISMGNKSIPPVIDSIASYFSWLSGLPMLVFKILMIVFGLLGYPEFLRRSVFPFVSRSSTRSIFIECLTIVALYAVIIYFYIIGHDWILAILLGQVAGHMTLAAYLSTEHIGLPHDGDILNRTRSIVSSKVVKYVMWNMTYHAEHHAYPGVPYYSLPELNKRLDAELVYKDDSVPSFHKKVATKLFIGK